jgi:hypothetical protein
MNEREVTALLERRAATVPPSEPPIDAIFGTASGTRRHRHRTAFLAAPAVLTLIIGGGVAWEAAQDHSPSVPALADSPLPTHEGYRWVGMSGIAVEVPDSWTTSDNTCAPEAVDTVVFGHSGVDTCQDPRVDPRASSLHFETLDSRNFIAEMASSSEQHAISIGDLSAYRTDPIELNCPQPRPDDCESVFGGSVEIAATGVLVWVESPDRATVTAVLGSIRLVPDEYVAVPNVIGMAQSRAADILGKAGLSPTTQCPGGGHVCDGSFTVRRITPSTGSVVATAADVSMTVGPEVSF